MINLIEVSKRFGDLQALQVTSLAFEPGKTSVLLGPSGCGKSTLLRIIVGLLESDTGRVEFAGRTVTPDRWLQVRQRLGYVIQDGGLFPHLTCGENITLMARHLRRPADEIQQRLSWLAALTHLPPESLDRYPTQISGGQRQRVGLMRALFLDPDVILLDEPMGALDPLIRRELQDELRDIFQSLNKTVVVVTHDIGEAAFLGDQIVMLKQGAIVQAGSWDDLVERPSDPFVMEFLNAQRSPLHD